MDITIREVERAAATGDPQAQERLERLRRRTGTLGAMEIIIDGETYEVNSTRVIGYGDLVELDTDDGDFIVSESDETAGAAARERWAEMAENDPEEFRCIVGDESLVRWALGQSAGPGSVHVDSLSDWLDLTATVPEEEWASYDGTERDVEEVGSELLEDLGFTPTVAYRSN